MDSMQLLPTCVQEVEKELRNLDPSKSRHGLDGIMSQVVIETSSSRVKNSDPLPNIINLTFIKGKIPVYLQA